MRLLIIAIAVSLLPACGSPRRGEPIAGPLALDAHLARGRQVFDQHCHKCHVNGEGGLGPAINDKPLPKFMMHVQTRLGAGAMPSFSEKEISDGDLDALLDYLVALRRNRAEDATAAVGGARR